MANSEDSNSIAYSNEFGKPVYEISNANIKRLPKELNQTLYGEQYYELQINNQYFRMSSDMLDTLYAITRMKEGTGISIG